MNYKIPIIPYNEFWLDCDTETLYSIIYSMNQKYKVHFMKIIIRMIFCEYLRHQENFLEKYVCISNLLN